MLTFVVGLRRWLFIVMVLLLLLHIARTPLYGWRWLLLLILLIVPCIGHQVVHRAWLWKSIGLLIPMEIVVATRVATRVVSTATAARSARVVVVVPVLLLS